MASKKPGPVKRGGTRIISPPGRSAKAGTRPSGTALDDELSDLRELVVLHRSGDRTASWRLGRLASQRLGHTEKRSAPRTEMAQLAADIGLIPPYDELQPDKRPDESTLRQLMKFARIPAKQAEALHKAGVAWRGIVYWLGVDKPEHRSQLYQEMLKGLTNSTKIRAYIDVRFKKRLVPRFSGDCAQDFRKAQHQAASLASVLEALLESLGKHADCGSARQRRQLTKSLLNARKQINATMRKIR